MERAFGFRIIHADDAHTLYPAPEYVLVIDEFDRSPASAIGTYIFPNSKVINLVHSDTDHIYKIFMEHLTDLQEVYESLIDETSKKTFCGYWSGKITNRLADFVYSKDRHYLTTGFIPEKGAIVIDGGAYAGETAKMFYEMGYKVYSFEMDKKNFALAKKIIEEKIVVIENMGLGAYKHEVNYQVNGTGSRVSAQGSEKAQITTIDSYVKENNIPHIDLIKLDVEGSELDVLRGARTSIARWKPILLISAYHKLDDFWTLMNFVKTIRPDYEFAMRHYVYWNIDTVPFEFGTGFTKYFDALGLDCFSKDWYECCILAR